MSSSFFDEILTEGSDEDVVESSASETSVSSILTFAQTISEDVSPTDAQKIKECFPFLDASPSLIARDDINRLQWLEFRLTANCTSKSISQIAVTEDDPGGDEARDGAYRHPGLITEEFERLMEVVTSDGRNELNSDAGALLYSNQIIMANALAYLGIKEDRQDASSVSSTRYVSDTSSSEAARRLGQPMDTCDEGAKLLALRMQLVKGRLACLARIADSVGKQTWNRYPDEDNRIFNSDFMRMKVVLEVLERTLYAPLDLARLNSANDPNEIELYKPTTIWSWAYQSESKLTDQQHLLSELQREFRKFGNKNDMVYEQMMVCKKVPRRAKIPCTSASQVLETETLRVSLGSARLRLRVLCARTTYHRVEGLLVASAGRYRSECRSSNRDRSCLEEEDWRVSALVVAEDREGGECNRWLGRLAILNFDTREILDGTEEVDFDAAPVKFRQCFIAGFLCDTCSKTEAHHHHRDEHRKCLVDCVFKHQFVETESVQFPTGFWKKTITLDEWVANRCDQATHAERWQVWSRNKNVAGSFGDMLQRASKHDVRQIVESREYMSCVNGVVFLGGKTPQNVVKQPAFYPYECRKRSSSGGGCGCGCISCMHPTFYRDVTTFNFLPNFVDTDRFSPFIINGFRRKWKAPEIERAPRFDPQDPPCFEMVPNRKCENPAKCACCGKKCRPGEPLRICTSPEARGGFCCPWVPKDMTWGRVQTSFVDFILKDQDITDYDTICWFKIWLMGKMLFTLNRFDTWQVALFLKGEAGTGKSLLADILQHIKGNKVGVIGDRCEKNFPLGSYVVENDEKHCVVGSEVKNEIALNLGAANLQEMISGGFMSINRKNTTTWQGTWDKPVLLMGNYLPSFQDTAGSMFRRLVLGDFPNEIGEKDLTLKRKAFGEAVYYAMSSAGLYLNKVKHHCNRSVWASNPPMMPHYFHKIREHIKMETNSFYEFLQPRSACVVVHPDAYVTEDDLVKTYDTWCRKFGKRKIEIGKSDTTRGVYRKLGITRETLTLHYPPGTNESDDPNEKAGDKKAVFLNHVGLVKHYKELADLQVPTASSEEELTIRIGSETITFPREVRDRDLHNIMQRIKETVKRKLQLRNPTHPGSNVVIRQDRSPYKRRRRSASSSFSDENSINLVSDNEDDSDCGTAYCSPPRSSLAVSSSSSDVRRNRNPLEEIRSGNLHRDE